MRGWSGGGRGAALVLLACALLMRLAIPAGWMPDASAHGFRLILCPGVVPPPPPMHHAMHMPGMHHAEHARHDPAQHDPSRHDPLRQMPCDFAGAVHAAALANPIATPLAAPEPPALPAPLPRTLAAPGRGLAAPPPPATGPPLPA